MTLMGHSCGNCGLRMKCDHTSAIRNPCKYWCDDEHVPRSPSVCKRCEYLEFVDRHHYCEFWGLDLIKVKWCNK
jgi:hypothetical protein